MRVAVAHSDAKHPNHGTCAYRLGNVEDFTHPLTGETTSADDILVSLLDRARAEFPESDGYRVWPETLVEDEGTEDCYLCAGEGEVPHARLKDDEAATGATTCPNCKGEQRTSYGKWREVDEDALRQRASGEPVEVPLAKDVKTKRSHGVEAAQDTDAAQEGSS